MSEADKQWLDHEGNVVEEQVLLDKLEAASDYERAVGKLGDPEKQGHWQEEEGYVITFSSQQSGRN